MGNYVMERLSRVEPQRACHPL